MCAAGRETVTVDDKICGRVNSSYPQVGIKCVDCEMFSQSIHRKISGSPE